MDEAHHAAAAELRAEFDASFAAAPAERTGVVALLAIRVGSTPFALRLLEASGIMTVRQVVPVPSRRPELLGVVGLRGDVVPVYGLARLVLRGDETEAPRWMVLAGTPDHQERVAFAFGAFEGHLMAAADELRPAEPRAGDHVVALHQGVQVRPVLSLPSLVAAVTTR